MSEQPAKLRENRAPGEFIESQDINQIAQAVNYLVSRSGTSGTVLHEVLTAPLWDENITYAQGDLAAYQAQVWRGDQPTTSVTVDRNEVTNPLFDPAGAAWWHRINGGDVAASQPVAGTRRYTIVNTVEFGNDLVSSPAAPAVAGDQWAASIVITCPPESPSEISLGVGLGVSDDAVPSPITWVSAQQIDLLPGGSITVTRTGTVPSGKSRTHIRIQAGDDTALAGAMFDISSPTLNKGGTPVDFFHGGQADTTDVTYEWEGVANESASIRTTTTRTMPPDPPATPAWVRVWHAGRKLVPAGPFTVSNPEATGAAQMSNDRTRFWTLGSRYFRESTDEGLTWTIIHDFGANLATVFVRQFGNGELLVGTSAQDGTPPQVWLTEGYPSGTYTWTQVLTAAAPGATFPDAWSVHVVGNVGVVAEYGPKAEQNWGGMTALVGENSRYAWMTLDSGKTWTQVFDLNEHVTTPNATGVHVHGVAWDRWWDRIWVTWGDDENGIMYSDDLGATWHHAQVDRTVMGPWQAVGILPLPGAILFGTDSSPNGILRIDRAHGKRTGTYPIEVAHAIDGSEDRTALCTGIFWTGRDDHPAFFAFGAESLPLNPPIVATYDGWTFAELWRDPIQQPAGSGLRSVLGPTLSGHVIAKSRDTRYPDGWTQVRGPAPY